MTGSQKFWTAQAAMLAVGITVIALFIGLGKSQRGRWIGAGVCALIMVGLFGYSYMNQDTIIAGLGGDDVTA